MTIRAARRHLDRLTRIGAPVISWETLAEAVRLVTTQGSDGDAARVRQRRARRAGRKPRRSP